MNRIDTDGTAKLLQEYSALEHLLLGDLRELLEEFPTETDREGLLAVLDALLDIIPQRFELEEEGGYLPDVLEEFPNWFVRIVRLKQQHCRIYSRLLDFRSRLARHASVAHLTDELRHELREWTMTLVSHHRHESSLVQAAYNVDFGGES